MTASPALPAAGPPATVAVLRYGARLLERRDVRRAVWRAAGRDPHTYRRLVLDHLASGKSPTPTWPHRDNTLTDVNAR